MTQYYEIATAVEAVKVPKLLYGYPPFGFWDEKPDWIVQEIESGRLRPRVGEGGYWYYDLYDSDFNSHVHDAYLEGTAAPGDYIVREPYDKLRVRIALSFENNYRPLEKEPIMTDPKERRENDPVTTPTPPHETSLGKDATPAGSVAEVQESAIVAEELATDE